MIICRYGCEGSKVKVAMGGPCPLYASRQVGQNCNLMDACNKGTAGGDAQKNNDKKIWETTRGFGRPWLWVGMHAGLGGDICLEVFVKLQFSDTVKLFHTGSRLLTCGTERQ